MLRILENSGAKDGKFPDKLTVRLLPGMGIDTFFYWETPIQMVSFDALTH